MNSEGDDVCGFADNTETAPAAIVEDSGRRRFLFGGIVTALAAVTTACSSDPDDSGAGTSTTSAVGEATTSTSTSTSTTVMEATETTLESDDDAAETPSTDAGGDAEGGEDAGGDAEGGGGVMGSSDDKNQEADVPVRDGDVDGGRDPNNPTANEVSAQLAVDLATIGFAAGLEVLAVNTYRRASSAAAEGALGPVPPAVSEFITTVMGHHQAALNELNRALLLSGQSEVTSPDAKLQPLIDAAFAGVTDVPGAARLALMLEEIAAATYLAALPTLASPEAIALAASVYPIDMQHASVLHFVLGEYPVPEVFGTVERAAIPA